MRWGCNPKARQMRLTVLWLSPLRWAMDRVLQWGRVPGRGLQRQRNHTLHVVIGNRSRPSAARFVRQSVQPPFQESGNAISPTVSSDTPRSVPTVVLLRPSAQPQNHSGPQRQSLRRFSDDETHRSKVSRSTSSKISGGIGRPIAMVILLWAANPEDTSSRILLQ